VVLAVVDDRLVQYTMSPVSLNFCTFVAFKADISLAVNKTSFISFSIHDTYFHRTNYPQTLDT
jgi:hypothetical protein